MNARAAVECRRGFSLVEIMVALTITGVVIMSLAAGAAAVARMSGQSASLVRRAAAVDETAGALASMPWSDLPTGTVCDTVVGDFSYERCVTATDVTTKKKEFTITVTPNDPQIAPDTATVERGRILTVNPLNVP